MSKYSLIGTSDTWLQVKGFMLKVGFVVLLWSNWEIHNIWRLEVVREAGYEHQYIYVRTYEHFLLFNA